MDYDLAKEEMANKITRFISNSLETAQKEYSDYNYFVLNIGYDGHKTYQGYDKEGRAYRHFAVYFSGAHLSKEKLQEQGIYTSIYYNSVGSPTHMLVSKSRFFPVAAFLKNPLALLFTVALLPLFLIFGLIPSIKVLLILPILAILPLLLCHHQDMRVEQRDNGKKYRRLPGRKSFVTE